MKLVLYGGGDHEDTKELDLKLLSLAESTTPKITFIPSYSYDADIDFHDFVIRFSRLGVKRFINFPVDTPYDNVLLNEAFTSDIIYLDGGNTFYFLNSLRKNRLMWRLKTFVRNGGVLAGLSAGAIILTPNIKTAAFPAFDCDENYNRLKNFNSLGVVPFEFFPHYKNSKRYNDAILNYSSNSDNPIIASSDGHGLVVTSKGVSFHNRATIFYRGKRYMKQAKDVLNLATGSDCLLASDQSITSHSLINTRIF